MASRMETATFIFLQNAWSLFHRVNGASLIPAIAAASSSDKPNASEAAIFVTTSSVRFVGAPSFKRPRRERFPAGRVAVAGIIVLGECLLSPPSFAIKTRPGGYQRVLRAYLTPYRALLLRVLAAA
jgi:hypothetical protein